MSHTLNNTTHYDITISHHTPHTHNTHTHNGTPPPQPVTLLDPTSRPSSPLRHATLTHAFQSVDFTDARYHMPLLVYDQSYYQQLSERVGYASAVSELDGGLVGNRVVVERLDYRNVLSVYINSYRIHATPLAKQRKEPNNNNAALATSPSNQSHTQPHQPADADTTATTAPIILKPTPLPTYLLSIASSAFLLHCTPPKQPSRTFVILATTESGAVTRFFGLVNDIVATPRSDQWLDVPDAARMQSQLRTWEEEKEAEMGREETEHKQKLLTAQKPTADNRTASPLLQPVATYGGTSSRPTRSALLTSSSSRSSHLGGIKNLGNSCYMNAILQALLSIPAFVAALTSPRLISATEHELPSPLSPSSFYSHLVSLALLYQQSDHGVLDIGELKEVIGGKRERFAGNTQQDAHEFLSECLNALQDDVVKCVRVSSDRAEVKVDSMKRADSGDSGDSGSSDESSSSSGSAGDGRSSRSPSPLPLPLIRSPSASSFISSALPRHLQRLIHRLSPIHRTFHCEIEYTLTCTNPACGYTRKNKESCFDLSLDLPDLPAPSNHRLASPIPSSTASPLLSPQFTTSSPSPEHSPTLSPSLSPRASPSLPPLSLSASDHSPEPITLDPVRSASPSIEAAVSSSPPVPTRRRQKASAPPSSSLASLLSTFFSPRTLICNCAHCPSTSVTISAAMRQMPAVLILHVKRFLPNLSKGSYDKRSDRVKVETDLNVSFACKADTKRPGMDEEKDEKRKSDESDGKQIAQQPSEMNVDDGELPLSTAAKRDLLPIVDANGSSKSTATNGIHAPLAVRATKRIISEEVDLTRSDDSDTSPVVSKKHKQNNQPSTTSPPHSPTAEEASASTTRRRRVPTSQDTRVTRAMHRKLTSASATASPSISASAAAASPSPPPPPPPSITLPPPPPPPPPLPPPPVYQLSSIVHHRGAFAYSGHYLTDIVRQGSSVWTRYDDQFVKDVTSEHSLRQAESEGYIFFYVYASSSSGGRML